MEKENKKKGLFERLIGSKKTKKSSCCCNIELEEVPEENTTSKDAKDSDKNKNSSCCK